MTSTSTPSDDDRALNPEGTTFYLGREPLGLLTVAMRSRVQPGPEDLERLRVKWDQRLTVSTSGGELHEYLSWQRQEPEGSAFADSLEQPRYTVDGLGLLHVFYENIDMGPTLVRSYNAGTWATVSQPGVKPFDGGGELIPSPYGARGRH